MYIADGYGYGFGNGAEYGNYAIRKINTAGIINLLLQVQVLIIIQVMVARQV